MLLKTFAVAALAAASLAAGASPLSEYNLILLGDYNYQGGEVEGTSFVGGHLNAAGQSPTFSMNMPSVQTTTVEIAGDVNAGNINLNSGSLAYGGALHLQGNINLNGGAGTGVFHDATLGAKAASLQSELFAETTQIAGLANNGTFAGGQLSYSGLDSLAVFNINAVDLFAQNTSLKLSAGNASTVIINVAGTNIQVGGGVNLTGNGFQINSNAQNVGASNILWNFADALSINFNNLAMVGSILAPKASISGGAVFDGSVAAFNYTGAREFHRHYLNWTPATQHVAEPSTLLLTLFGFILVFAGRLGRAK